jgi:hypothetical protein
MARQGLQELRNALYPDSNVAVSHVESGVYGTALPSEVAAERQKDLQPGEAPSPSILESRVKEADRQANLTPHEREPPSLERE